MEPPAGRRKRRTPCAVIGYRHQRTLAASAEIEGVGFITGARVRVRFRPGRRPTPASSSAASIARPPRPSPPASNPSPAPQRRTTLGPARARRHARRTPPRGPRRACASTTARSNSTARNRRASTAPPRGFVAVLDRGRDGDPDRAAGRSARRHEPIVVSAGGATIATAPRRRTPACAPATCSITAHSARSRGRRTRSTFAPASSSARSRRAGRSSPSAEAEALRAQGVGKHLTPADLLVFGRARADRQPPAVRRRTGPAQGARPDRRPGAVRVRPGRARGRVPLRARAERGTGPAAGRGGGRVFKSASLQVVKSTRAGAASDRDSTT